MRISKEFKFEAAHRLSNYKGKCERVHGHNYKVIVIVEGHGLDNAGILVDFGDIKAVLKEKISDRFDHRLILNEKDPENTKLFAHFPEDWLVWVPYNPTAESMAIDFLNIMKQSIPETSSVIVYETDDSYAQASYVGGMVESTNETDSIPADS